jgi:ABC-2 type transport system ATP-binding protein
MIQTQPQIGTRAEAVIRVDGLMKRYRNKAAVDGLTLAVPGGSIFGLLGENGAGKTTTIQTLLGLIRPDAGRLEVLGLDPTRHGLEVRRRVGYVPEAPVLYDWMTVAEIGWFAAGFHPDSQGTTSTYQYRYTELSRGFELPVRQKIKALSKGMRAKVSLALALASDPPLLVLDEPTSGLDVLVRLDFLESMVDLAGAGRTVLLSSHQISEVERVASHVALLHQGRLLLAEPLDELKSRMFLLSVVFASRDHPPAPPEGRTLELIDASDAPRQARWLVRAADRAACEALRALPGVEGIEIETPSLEEIYTGYMRARRPEPARPLAVHVASA